MARSVSICSGDGALTTKCTRPTVHYSRQSSGASQKAIQSRKITGYAQMRKLACSLAGMDGIREDEIQSVQTKPSLRGSYRCAHSNVQIASQHRDSKEQNFPLRSRNCMTSFGSNLLACHLLVPIRLLAFLDAIPLVSIGGIVDVVCRQLRNVRVFHFFRQDEVEEEVQEGRDREASLEDELDGIIEASQGAIGAGVREDVGKPSDPSSECRPTSERRIISRSDHHLGNTYVGTRVAPNPRVNPAVRMNRFRRVKGMVDMILTPLTATEANRNVVMPPSTALGIATSAAANLAKTPAMNSQKQAAISRVSHHRDRVMDEDPHRILPACWRIL